MNAERLGGHEQPDESVVERNFRMLVEHVNSPDTAESIGGNANKVIIDGEPWGCFAINGVIDARTGEVLEYGNIAQATERHQEEFGIIIGVPPMKLLLKGVSEVIVEIQEHPHSTLSPSSMNTLMRMKPLWDAHSAAASNKYLAMRESPSKSATKTHPTEAAKNPTFIDRLRKLFGG